MVRYTSAIATPCLITLSRSTSMNCCGTLPRKVVFKLAISGRFRAATRNAFRFEVRNSTSLPARSSRTQVNPPEVPTPALARGDFVAEERGPCPEEYEDD